ncbi:MAG: GTPase/DUF3482 domain-containing protein [Acidobacteria bacterium]|nr:GTPase/DUF3482 domain-containing protein [Acidobacteriota bacterium]
MRKRRKPLRLAVVGHTNTGKTSLLQTLLRRRDFGEVSASGGTTRAVEAGEVADDEGSIAVLLDTPGFEESDRLRDAIESTRTDRYDDPRTLLDRFLASPAAADEEDLGLEAASVQAALRADVLLYAIDARGDAKPRHLDELAVLAATARPLVPVLNYTGRPDAHPARWRSACARQGLHATVAFDAVVYDDAGERRLLAAVKALAPGHEGAVDRWTALRARERREAMAAATEAAAELLVTAAAAVVVTAPKERDKAARQGAVEAATARLLKGLRKRETVTRDRIAATLGFFGDEARAVTFDVAEALGGVDFLSPASLERAGLWAAGAGAGLVAAGAMVDIATGGVSLGGFAVLGAVGTALGAAGASGRKVLRRLRGQDEVRLADAGVELLAARAVATIRAMLARGHAAVEPVPIESAVKESLERDAGPAWRASWAPARGRAAWSELSRPRPRGVPGQARAEAVKRVAAVLADRIRETPRSKPRGDPAGATESAAPPTAPRTAVTRTR